MKIDHVLRADSPWIHLVVDTPAKAYEAAWALRREPHVRVASLVLRGKKMRTWQALCDEIGAALQFPPYFGENGDALSECFNDLEWLEADAYVLTILDSVCVLDQDGPNDNQFFWELLQDTAREWGQPINENVPRQASAFRVVVQCRGEEEAGLRARLVSVTNVAEA